MSTRLRQDLNRRSPKGGTGRKLQDIRGRAVGMPLPQRSKLFSNRQFLTIRAVFPALLWCGHERTFYVSPQQPPAAHSQAPQMRTAADDEERRNLGMREEPIRKRINFAERAQSSHADALQSELLVLEQYKKVALWRRDTLRHLQQIDGLRQAQFRKAANLKSPDAQQKTRRHPLFEKSNRVDFAAFVAGQNKNSIRMRGRIGASQPIE